MIWCIRMKEINPEFESLPQEYQHAIKSAQDELNITIVPLQELVSGFSGNTRSIGYPTVRLYHIFETLLNDPALAEEVILGSDRIYEK